MKKRNEKGFFLVETMLVISVVAVVLLIVFKLFTSVYYGFMESENYNTVNAINALSNIQKYYESIGVIDTSLLSETNTYIELTNDEKYFSPYYTRIKEEYGITDVYLIDLDYFLNSDNVSNFPVLFRRYLKTLKNVEGIALVICTKGNEFSYVKLEDSVHITLNGDEEDEYGVYINVGGTFTDPGYTGWDGNAPQTEWENGKVLDTNTPGTYYLHYNFDGYLFRRKVEVGNYNASFAYTGSEQEYIVNAPGYYKIEAWGAQGGYGSSSTYSGGYGGYSVGAYYLEKGDILYINVGGMGDNGLTKSASVILGGYNGGGNGFGNTDKYVSGGGGATHIAKTSGLLSTLSSNTSNILIVAAGGGGGAYESSSFSGLGGSGGGYIGVASSSTNSEYTSTGATQTGSGSGYYPGAFGKGGCNASSNGCSGGGGGLYGGDAARYAGGGSGGSGYIYNLINIESVTKHMSCYHCVQSSDENVRTISVTETSEEPLSDKAKIGNGYAKITLLYKTEPILTIEDDEKINIDFTETYKKVMIKNSGYYKLEAWGAQGGYGSSSTYRGGYGGYAVGNYYFEEGDVLYVNVGGMGNNGLTKSASVILGGYNGGGNGFGNTDKYVSGGGGATHIAKTSGLLSTLSSNTSNILIVAAGGGGGAYESSSFSGLGGSGGGYIGVASSSTHSSFTSTGATQTGSGSGYYPGAFGKGGCNASSNGCSGGGGGLYGGDAARYAGGGAGGSGYIGNSLLTSKYMYCYNCTTSDTVETKTYTTTCAEETPTENCAKIGNGYAKITYLGPNYTSE